MYQSKSKNIENNKISTSLIIQRWNFIFLTLFNPLTHIYDDLPKKYALNKLTTRNEIRKIFFPLNPSIDSSYSSYWELKYNTKYIQPRLTLNEVIPKIHYISKNILFSGDAIYLCGIELIHGLIIIYENKIQFYDQSNGEYFIIFEFNRISSISLRQFQYQPRGIAIEEINSNISLFAFCSNNLRDNFIEIMKKFNIKIINTYNISDLTKQWIHGNITNFEYLLELNFRSGRSWSDYSQFPFLPWLIYSYKSDEIYLRDLSYPIFAQSNEQKNSCNEYYKAVGHHFPGYISNIASTLYYLVRCETVTTSHIKFNDNKFDLETRRFNSFMITTKTMLSSNAKTVFEMVPEFFFLPEIFENINEIHNFDNFVLPDWAKTPEKFVRKLRKILESPNVTEKLNEWIDLIWGICRNGQLALDKFNVFQDYVLVFNQDEYLDDQLLFNAKLGQIHNCGHAPTQLFNDFHPKKVPVKPKKIVGFTTNVPKAYRRASFDSLFHSSCTDDSFLGFESKFVDDLAVENSFQESDTMMIAHKIPIVSYWKSLKCLGVIGAHPSKITAVYFQHQVGFAVVGHLDGYITVFSLDPFLFVREIKTAENRKVTLLRISKSDSTIVVFQNNDENGTIISNYSVNGKFLGKTTFKEKVFDCCLTSNPIGVCNNIAFLLTKKKIMLMKVPSLKKLEKEYDCPDPYRINIENNERVVISTRKRKLFRYEILTE